MKKLKNKILITIFLILTISITIILIAYNSSDYLREKNNITDNLNRMIPTNRNSIKPPENSLEHNKMPPSTEAKEKRFMDVKLYTVILDDNNNIYEIVNHTNEDNTPTEITEEATKIIKKSNKNSYIGNLYVSKYAYNYKKSNHLVIMDISETNSKLRTTLIISIIIFIIFEIIAYIISNIISNWLIKPVEASFNKQKQFIADASHELKTPLSVIIASAEALDNDKNNKKWLTNIKNESDRMNNLIKDLLDLAKLENDEIKRVY